MKDDLTKADSRWRKKRFFQPEEPRRRRWPWVLLVLIVGAVVFVLVKKGLLP